MLYGVTQRPTLKSVIDEKEDFFYFTKYSLGGEGVNLYDLENSIVRKEFNEPRIHMALNCASGGCPELPPEAFTPEKLEEQLTRELFFKFFGGEGFGREFRTAAGGAI